jgi:DNA-binding PucR family transcriptional regulator
VVTVPPDSLRRHVQVLAVVLKAMAMVETRVGGAAAQRAVLLERIGARRGEFVANVAAEFHSRCPELFAGGDDQEAAAVVFETAASIFDHYVGARDAGEDWREAIPDAVGKGSRFVAARRVPLDVLMRAYRAAHACVSDMLIEELLALGARSEAQAALFKAALRAQFAYIDHLMEVASKEYAAELEALTRSEEQRRVELVTRILEGEQPNSPGLGYELDHRHLGLVLEGPRSDRLARSLARGAGDQILVISRGETSTWAWLATPDGAEESLRARVAALSDEAPVVVGLGEPAAGIRGFRLTHSQAVAAHRLAGPLKRRMVCYAEVGLLAAVADDERARESFVDLQLGPLAGAGDKAPVLRETLAAYFQAEDNAAAAAVRLGVHERSVRYRLRRIEELLGIPITARRAELQVALQLAQISAAST